MESERVRRMWLLMRVRVQGLLGSRSERCSGNNARLVVVVAASVCGSTRFAGTHARKTHDFDRKSLPENVPRKLCVLKNSRAIR